MAVPQNIPIFDGLVIFPGSLDKSSVKYLYGEGVSDKPQDPVDYVLRGMDKFGVRRALVDIVGLGAGSAAERAVRAHPDRFVALLCVDPNEGMKAVRQIDEAIDEHGIVGVSTTPAITVPQVPINSKKAYPIYSKCIERNLALFPLTGVPGPQVPFYPQKVEHLDEVCSFFPELKIVMRHGGVPWTDLAIKLMVKYPNLYYSTTAYTPRHYPQDIVDFANSSRGMYKIIYGGHFAMGLTYEKIFSEMPDLPLKDEVWPLFLHKNLEKVLGLD